MATTQSATHLRTAHPAKQNSYGVKVMPLKSFTKPEEQLLLATAQCSGIQNVRALPLPGGKRALLIKDNQGLETTLITARPHGDDENIATAISLTDGDNQEYLVSQMTSLPGLGQSVSRHNLGNMCLSVPTGPSELTDYPSEYMDAHLELPYDQNMQKQGYIPMDFMYGERAKARQEAAKKWHATFGRRRLDNGELTPQLSHYELNDSQASHYNIDSGIDDVTDAILARIHAVEARRDAYNAAQQNRNLLRTACSDHQLRQLATAYSRSRDNLRQYETGKREGAQERLQKKPDIDFNAQEVASRRVPQEAPQDYAVRRAREFNEQQQAQFGAAEQQQGRLVRVPSQYMF